MKQFVSVLFCLTQLLRVSGPSRDPSLLSLQRSTFDVQRSTVPSSLLHRVFASLRETLFHPLSLLHPFPSAPIRGYHSSFFIPSTFHVPTSLGPDPCSHEKAPQRTYPQTRLKWRKTPTVNQLLGRAAGLLSGICLFLAAARLLAFVFTRRATGRSTGRFLWSGLRTTTTTTSGSSRSSKNHKYGNE